VHWGRDVVCVVSLVRRPAARIDVAPRIFTITVLSSQRR